MNTAEQNFLLVQEIEANRKFLLMAYAQNPHLLKNAEPRIKLLFVDAPVRHDPSTPLWGEGGAGGKQRGISLIELIMFIVIVSVALAGILLVMNTVTRGSADPLIHKQALAIAESMLEEVELMPFTFCDPDDANAATATAATAAQCPAAGGVGGVEVIGPEAGETRYSNTTPFDNVNDYNGCQMNTGTVNGCDATGSGGVVDITGNPVGLPAGYRVVVDVIPFAIVVGGLPNVANTESQQVRVTVTGPDNVGVTVDGIRTRYSPNI